MRRHKHPHVVRGAVLLCATLVLLAFSTGAYSQVLYWSDRGAAQQVGHVNLDGAGSVTLGLPQRPLGIDVDFAAGFVYWIQKDGDSIRRSNLDFTGMTTVVPNVPLGGLNVAIDPAADALFLTSDVNRVIRYRISDGTQVGSFSLVGGLFSDDMALDPVQQFVYVTYQSGPVVRWNYDGTGETTLLDLEVELGDGSGDGGAAGVTLDPVAAKLYFSVTNSNLLARCNVDGTGLETVLALDATERPFGMDLSNGRMYWTDLDNGRLRSANIDGTDVQTILSGLDDPRAVRIAAIPEPALLGPLTLAGGLLTARRRRSLATDNARTR